MTPHVEINMAEFNRSLNKYVLVNRRELSVIINIKMLMILKRARELTPVASRAEILRDMGGEDVAKFKKNTFGPIRGHGIAKGAHNAYALLMYRAKKKGLSIPYKARRAKAKALIGRALSAVGTLRRGWNLSLKKFALATKEAFSVGTGRPVKNKGTPRLKIAEPGWNPIAVGEYAMGIKKGGTGEFFIDPRVEAALVQSFAEETASMDKYVADKMRPGLEKQK